MRVGSEGQIVSKRERRKEKMGEIGERKERSGEVEGGGEIRVRLI